MSDSHASQETHAAPPAEPQFIPEELVEFKADDTEAGKNIGRMLVAFFVCLLVLVAGVNVLMNRTINARGADMTAPFAEEGHGAEGHGEEGHGTKGDGGEHHG